MNFFSVLLYVADVTENMIFATKGFLIVAGAMTLIGVIGGAIAAGEHSWEHETSKRLLKLSKWGAVLLPIAAVIYVFTPEPVTIYSMAASEMGEEVIQSEYGQRMAARIEKFLELKIDELVGVEAETTEE
jgi:hypothetical protein